MNRASAFLAGVVVTVSACDKIPFIGGGDAADSAALAADTTAAALANVPPPAVADTNPPLVPVPEPDPAPPVTRVASQTRALVDEPWTPTDTGTVAPGMTHEDVIAVWGPTVAERSIGAWTYLYFRNGCEVTCGMFDVVLLQDGQVVDAIVRGPGHTYAGVSSSPPEREAVATPPETSPISDGTTLNVP